MQNDKYRSVGKQQLLFELVRTGVVALRTGTSTPMLSERMGRFGRVRRRRCLLSPVLALAVLFASRRAPGALSFQRLHTSTSSISLSSVGESWSYSSRTGSSIRLSIHSNARAARSLFNLRAASPSSLTFPSLSQLGGSVLQDLGVVRWRGRSCLPA